MTLEEYLNEIIRVFEKVGIENAKGEAEMLVCHVLGIDRTYMYLHKNEDVNDKVALASAGLINERCKGRPIQYVIGKTNFYGIDVAVDERVLIPRPETEILVDEALKQMKNIEEPSVLDLCCGSGCIAMAVAANKPESTVTAIDLSIKAYQLATVNCRPYSNIKVVRSDLFEKAASYDFILTNPPYVIKDEIPKLQKEVKDFEPMMALDGGPQGLDIIERIINDAPKHLNDGGFIFMEIGEDQGEKVLEMTKKSGFFKDFNIIKDLEGHDRILKASKL